MVKLPKLALGDPVCVNWRDAYSFPGWHAPEDYESWWPQLAHVITVSIYVHHDAVNLHLAQSVRGDRLADIIEIPRSLIDKIKILK